MAQEAPITTGIDGLIRVVHERGRMELNDAAELLGVTPDVAEEWARLLEEEKVLRLEYKLTRIFLVWRGPTRDELSGSVKKIEEQRELMINDVRALIERAKTRQGELNIIKKDLTELAQVMDEKLPERLRRQLDALRTVDRDKEKVFESRIVKVNEVKESLDSLEREIGRKHELVDQMRKRAEEIEASPELMQRVAEIVEARKRLDESLDSMQKMRASLQESLQKSGEQRSELTNSIDVMTDLEKKMEDMENAEKEAKRMIKELSGRVKRVDSSMGTMHEMVESGEVNRNLKRLKEEKDKIVGLEGEIKEESQRLASSSGSISKALEENETKYEELLSAKNRLLKTLDDYDGQLAKVDMSFKEEAGRMKALADEMIGVLNSSRKEIEEQVELARKGIEKYEGAVAKREEVMRIRDAIDDMEMERDRLVKQLRLISKSVETIQVTAEVSGRAGEISDIKQNIEDVRIAEKAYDAKRTHLQKMIKEMMGREGGAGKK